ncbi:MAG: hypothetical protein EZS28_019535, partial [Streblomastix strix]
MIFEGDGGNLNTLKGRDKSPLSEFYENTNLFEMLIFNTNSTIDLSNQGGFDRDSCGAGQHPCQTLSASISYGLISLVTGQLDFGSIFRIELADYIQQTSQGREELKGKVNKELEIEGLYINNITGSSVRSEQ